MVHKFLNILIGFLFLICQNIAAQPHNLTIQIANQPDNEIVLGSIKGDDFTPIDTVRSINNTINFQLPTNTNPGVCRIIFGQTPVAKVLDEPPQQLDLIYNNENIEFKTDFEYPEDSLEVIQSVENRIWFEFFEKEKAFQKEIGLLEQEADYYWSKKDTSNAIKKANEFNQLQMDRELRIDQIVSENPDLYAARLIEMYHEPFRDGYINASQRNTDYQSTYFNNLDFTDESLINSSIYTDKIFEYLVTYNHPDLTQEQREEAYKKAIDIVLANTNKNEKVYEFILDYLVGGFEILRMDNLIDYIADKYSGTTCQTDEVTTLELKLLQQKMKVGTVVPDFTLDDINGDPVTLSDVLKDKNLVFFWASWCPHCDEMVPQILNWQKSAGLTDFEIIAISLDDVEKEWRNKVFETGIESWYNLSSLKKWDCPVALEYNVYATPTMFVIDRDRKILGKPLNPIELKEVVSE